MKIIFAGSANAQSMRAFVVIDECVTNQKSRKAYRKRKRRQFIADAFSICLPDCWNRPDGEASSL